MINYILLATIIIGFGIVSGILIIIGEIIEDKLEEIIPILKDIDHKG